MYTVSFTLEQNSEIPMYEQLYRKLCADIHSAALRSGEKLPSKRAMCGYLGVSMSTVETAYGLLLAEGYICSKPKSGYYVTDFDPFDGAEERLAPVRQEKQAESRESEFDFSTSAVDTSLFPYSVWAKLNKETVYARPELLQRGERQGDAELRRALCDFLAAYRGVSCTPDQIVIGAGMEYLSSLLVQLFPIDSVFGIEDPGYSGIYYTVLNSGRSLRFIPLDDRGMSVSELEKSGAAAAYITPSHQFPMGLTVPASRRSQLLSWASKSADRYIIEDDYDSDFRYFSRPIPSMQSMDRRGKVIYIGTFSRSLAPSIRIAYMVLPEKLLKRYRQLFSHSLSTVSRFEQAVMARFISEGYYARYLRRVGNLYKKRRGLLVSAFESIEGVSVSGSGGGMHFLVKCAKYSESELISKAAEKGIRLRGLSEYCRGADAEKSTLVIGFGGLENEKIGPAAELLRKAWR